MVLLSMLAGDALACGGFFCNRDAPVDQTGETIIFEVADGTVTTHVMVEFEGAAEEFGWILPTPGMPDIFLSTEALFDNLQQFTDPVPVLHRTGSPGCEPPPYEVSYSSGVSSSAGPDSAGGGVTVVERITVGPYEGVVLSATDVDALTTWLTDNGFGLPANFAQSAAPYLAGDNNFLAMKLAKDAEVGDLPPLGVRWPGNRPSVPLTLTAVAAQPNLPLTVYVLGNGRAVPLSYLHVQLNPMVYDWFGRGRNWLEMIGKAADEAGGRGFATTYAGPTPSVFLGCEAMNTSGLELIESAKDWFLALPDHGFNGTPEVLEVLREFVPAPAGVPERSFYNDPEYHADAWAALDATFNPIEATAALESDVRVPCVDAQTILDRNPYTTRLTSTISPEEMTVDPEFGINPGLPDVSNVVEATLNNNCDGTSTLFLPGGYELEIARPGERSEPTDPWIEDRLDHHALVIEQLSETGTEVLGDYTDTLVGDEVARGIFAEGCGCTSTGSAGAAWVVGLALLAVRRRR